MELDFSEIATVTVMVLGIIISTGPLMKLQVTVEEHNSGHNSRNHHQPAV